MRPHTKHWFTFDSYVEVLRGDLVKPLWFDASGCVHLHPVHPRLGVDDPAHAIRRAERLMLNQAVPGVASDPVVPPVAEGVDPRVLRLKLERRDLNERVLLLIPNCVRRGECLTTNIFGQCTDLRIPMSSTGCASRS